MVSWKKYIAPSAYVIVCASPVYAQKYLSITEAQNLSFPEASNFEPSHVIYTPELKSKIEGISGQKIEVRGQQIWKALSLDKSGVKKLSGYILVDYVIGKHMVIDYSIAFLPDGSIKRVEILEYRESYGSEIKNPDWLKQFEGKTPESKIIFNDNITNIGGATLSSRHLTEGIKKSLAIMKCTLLPDSANDQR